MKETWIQSLGQEDPLEEEMSTHSDILAWGIPWTEEPGGLQVMGLQESYITYQLNTHTHTYARSLSLSSRGAHTHTHTHTHTYACSLSFSQFQRLEAQKQGVGRARLPLRAPGKGLPHACLPADRGRSLPCRLQFLPPSLRGLLFCVYIFSSSYKNLWI